MDCLIPPLPGFEVDSIQMTGDLIQVHAHCVRESAICPVCGCLSKRVHSRYVRRPADLPCSGRLLRLVLTVRRFFCRNAICPRKTFAERVADVVPVHAQKTVTLRAIMYQRLTDGSVQGK